MVRSCWIRQAAWLLPGAASDAAVEFCRQSHLASRKLFLAALNWEMVVLASMSLMLEYEVVLTRREQLERIGLTVKQTNAILGVRSGGS